MIRKNAYIVFVTIQLFASVAHGEGRLVEIVREDDKTIINYEISPGEVAVTGTLKDGKFSPFSGQIFRSEELKMCVHVTPPGGKNEHRWTLGSGYSDYVDGSKSFRQTREWSKDDETHLPVESILISTGGGDVDMYVIPYRFVFGKVNSLLILISDKKDSIKNVVDISSGSRFDWELSFNTIVSKADQAGQVNRKVGPEEAELIARARRQHAHRAKAEAEQADRFAEAALSAWRVARASQDLARRNGAGQTEAEAKQARRADEAERAIEAAQSAWKVAHAAAQNLVRHQAEAEAPAD